MKGWTHKIEPISFREKELKTFHIYLQRIWRLGCNIWIQVAQKIWHILLGCTMTCGCWNITTPTIQKGKRQLKNGLYRPYNFSIIHMKIGTITSTSLWNCFSGNVSRRLPTERMVNSSDPQTSKKTGFATYCPSMDIWEARPWKIFWRRVFVWQGKWAAPQWHLRMNILMFWWVKYGNWVVWMTRIWVQLTATVCHCPMMLRKATLSTFQFMLSWKKLWSQGFIFVLPRNGCKRG